MNGNRTNHRLTVVAGMLAACGAAILYAAVAWNDLGPGGGAYRNRTPGDDRMVTGFGLLLWYGLPAIGIVAAGLALAIARSPRPQATRSRHRLPRVGVAVAALSVVAWVAYYLLATDSAALR
jgi:hypothetical protein